MAIIRDRDLITDLNDIPIPLLISCVQEHLAELPRLTKLHDYFKGEHAILQRKLGEDLGLPNNKLMANHAKYITDVATGYFAGNPVKYEGAKIDPLTDLYKQIDVTSHDAELVKKLSMYGIGRELYYLSSDDVPVPKVTCIDPKQLFLVVDDSVEYRSLFGVHYYEKKDIANDVIGWNVFVYTQNYVTKYFTEDIAGEDYVLVEQPQQHYFDSVPVVEFWNNEEQQGDFEQQISLIDAYNILQSDRVNDKEQLVDAILMIKGMSLGDDEAEASKTIQLLKKFKVLEMPSNDSDAGWLIKQLNEQQVEILKDAIKSDIHAFSMVPDLTDENFAANASGVAMKYKLFGLEQLAVTKERFYVQGLRERLAMFARILAVKGQAVEVSDVTITMTRNLPANDLETAQMIQTLSGSVSNETLISRLSFISDPAAETLKLNGQKDADVKRNQAAFGMPMDVNTDETAAE